MKLLIAILLAILVTSASSAEVPPLIQGIRDGGYIPDREASDALAEKMPKLFYDQIRELARDSDTTPIYLFHYVAKIRGEEIKSGRNQGNHGSCCGQALANVLETMEAVQILALGERLNYTPVNADICYGLSRQWSNTTGKPFAGSTGSWIVGSVQELGSLHKLQYPGGFDLRQESPRMSAKYQREGVHRDLLEYAVKHKAIGAARVTKVSQLRGLLQSGFPVFIASRVGFANAPRSSGAVTLRDQYGRANASGSWAHAMAITGYHYSEQTGHMFAIENSWVVDENRENNFYGSYIRGPAFPQTLGHGMFWASAKDTQRILDDGDSWSFTRYDIQFKKRTITLKDALTYPGGPKQGLPEDPQPSYSTAP